MALFGKRRDRNEERPRIETFDPTITLRQRYPRKCSHCQETMQVCPGCGSYWCGYCSSWCPNCGDEPLDGFALSYRS
jgi:hypothetical protein